MNRGRRNFATLAGLTGLAAFFPVVAGSTPADGSRAFGLTALILDDHLGILSAWSEYLQDKLRRRIRFLQRGSYREIAELLVREIEFAWLGGVSYVRMQRHVKLVAVPLFKGKPRQRCYLIVPDTDTRTQSLLDLRGKIFAYADPDSNSGYLYTQYALIQSKERPADFFAKTFFTWGHRKAIEAVAAGLANGATVDGYLWETMQRIHPEVTSRTRVVSRSFEFGFPPVVAHADVPDAEVRAMRQALIEMPNDPAGRQVLQRLNLDGFIAGEPALFDGIAEIVRVVDGS